MPLRVAYNATPLLSPLTGIGNYIVELGQALAASGAVDAYSFYRYRWRHEAPVPPPESFPLTSAVVQRAKPWIPFRKSLRIAAQHLGFSRGLREHGIDLYHEPNYVPLRYDVPVVITVHDLSWLHYPETHPADRVHWLVRGMPRAVAEARAVLVDSDFVRDEVVLHLGLPPQRVHTAHLGVSEVYREQSSEETAPALSGLGLTHGHYLLTVGTIEPRKNLQHVLEAFALLPAELRERFPLVVAGAPGWRAVEIASRLRRLADDGQIRFLGHVDRQALPALYAGARAFVFASLYEGFGLPPLEAMACGVPVVVSNRASMPEIAGEAGILTHPEDPERTAGHLRELLEDPVAHAFRSRASLERASHFSWAACARRTHAVYQAALRR